MKTDGFEWNDNKAALNLRQHDITFEEAASVFSDRYAITIFDIRHSENEDRFVTLGISRTGRLIALVHAERDDNQRLISARKATKSESRTYEENRERLSRR